MHKKDPMTTTIFEKITMPVSHMYTRAEYLGIYVDPKGLEKARKYWSRKSTRALKKLTKLCPSDNSWKDRKTKEVMYGVNWASPKQVADILFDDLKLKSTKETGTGNRSTDESVLLQLAKVHEVPQLILDYRGAAKNLAFVESWQKRAVNNRIHPNFLIHGTVTGRPSCKEPNLQQVPRDPKMRNLFTAPPGWVLISADFSQVELRIVADMSQDPAMLFAFQTGQDLHTLTVQRIFGINEPTKEERKKGKAINFGFIYGMWWKKFIDYALDNYDQVFTPKEAERTRSGFFDLYKLSPWHKKQKNFARKYGYVRSLLGRKRRLPDAQLEDTGKYNPAKSEAERQAVNSPVQSCASDMNLTAACELEKKLSPKDFRIVSTTHDEILAEVRISSLMEIATEMKKTMENPQLLQDMGIEFSVPIIAELEAGPWGGGKEIEFKEAA